VHGVRFLCDLTSIDAQGRRRVEQQIFDEVLTIVQDARRFILLDMFLYNAYQRGARETTRALTAELTAALLAQKRRYPEMAIVVITDPVNTVYGALEPEHFTQLEAANIPVVFTALTELRDSNMFYSPFWRLLVRPFGVSSGAALPNPFGAGRVSVRSYLSLLNFKANHRKLIVADRGSQLAALVTSANPHDGSSAHGNVGLSFTGPAAQDLIETERAVLRFSQDQTGRVPALPLQTPSLGAADLTVQVVTEGHIQEAVLELLAGARPGDTCDLVMFYLSDREVVRALKVAHERGVTMRVVLDPNRDAFGHAKNGIPNRQTGLELHRCGIPVRWYDTHGEQCHAKMLFLESSQGACALLLGSANFTRRNLDNFNLETDVVLRGAAHCPAFRDARQYFEIVWNNLGGRQCTVDFADYRDAALLKRILYRIMESTGMSTF